MKSLARWVSIVGHPFVMVALLVVVSRLGQSARSVVESALLVIVATIIPVAILMVRQVRRGRWADADASKASERPVLFIVALAGIGTALAWVLLTDPRSYLVRNLLIMAGFFLIAAVVTRWIKVSLHAAFATLAAVTLSLLGSPVGYALLLMVPLVLWSRLALARHTYPELLVGLLLGTITGVALVRL